MHPDPQVHAALERATRVTTRAELRGFELGHDGRLPPSGVARCFEHMRWELGRRAEVPPGVLPARGVVRAQTHEYLRPIRWPLTWEGETALVRVGRTSIAYGHEIRDQSGEPLVRGLSVIVLLDESSRPAPTPDFFASYASDAMGNLPSLKVELDVDALAFEGAHSLEVRMSDHDSFQHVNQARYLDFLDDARRAAGLERPRRLTLSYEREVLAGDTLKVAFAPPRAADGARGFAMLRESDGQVVNRGAIAS